MMNVLFSNELTDFLSTEIYNIPDLHYDFSSLSINSKCVWQIYGLTISFLLKTSATSFHKDSESQVQKAVEKKHQIPLN